MNFKFLSFIFIALLAFSSCTKEEIMTDAELVTAIQNASKQVVDAEDLPPAATAVLSSEFSDRYNERTLLANGLGYEVSMADGDRPDDGSDGGDDGDSPRSYMYFDLDGRQLGERPDDGSGGGDDGVDESDVDCPELRLNIGDVCGEVDGNPVYVDENCECDGVDESDVDCPEIRLNIGDECGRDADGNPVYVDENCECNGAIGTDYDCPDLEANIGDECRDSNGNVGVVDSDCECN